MSHDASTYQARAESFLESLNALRELGNEDYSLADPDFRAAVALLAVHSAISFSDAVLVLANGSPSAGDHKKAPDLLKKTAKAHKLETDPITKFSRLIKSKHDFAYSGKTLKPTDVAHAVVRIESFAAWAFQAIAILGPKD